MIRKTTKCEKCGKDISKSNFKRHYDSCENNKPKYTLSDEWKINNSNEYKCPYCSKIFSKMGIMTHVLRIHTNPELYKNCYKLNYNYDTDIYEPWNKGLNKETDNRIKKQSETIKKRYENCEIKNSFKGKYHTKETKKIISEKLSKNNHGGKCKWFTYTKTDGTKFKLQGTWEVRFAKVLEIIDENWIKIGVGNKGHSFIWIDSENIEHYYTPDFYSPKLNKYFEVKGYWWGDDKNKMNQVISQHKNIKIEIVMKSELLKYEKLLN